MPFYVEEIVRGLIASGLPVRDDTGWTGRADVAAAEELLQPACRG